MAVVFGCKATVFEYDAVRKRHFRLLDRACYLQIISTNTERYSGGLKPLHKLAVYEDGSQWPYLEIMLGSNAFFVPSDNPELHEIKIVQSDGVRRYAFQLFDFQLGIQFSAILKSLMNQDMNAPIHASNPRRQGLPVRPAHGSAMLEAMGMSKKKWQLSPPDRNTLQQGTNEHSMPRESKESSGDFGTSFERMRNDTKENIYESIPEDTIQNDTNNTRHIEKVPPKLPPRTNNPVVCKDKENGDVSGDKDTVKKHDDLCKKLAEGISNGDVKKATDLAAELAKLKLKVEIHEVLDECGWRGEDVMINITVQIEEKQRKPPTLIKLDVNPCTTNVGALKEILFKKCSIPLQVQRWIIGRLLPKDNETLISLGVKTSGTVIFLYLLTAKDAGIGHLQNEQNNGAGIKDKTPSLHIQEHENIQNAPMGNSPPPVHASMPVNSNKASMVPYNVPGDNPGIQKQFQPSQSRQSSHLPVPPPRVEGWTCKHCTFINVPTRPGCEQCSSSRPADYKIPANFKLNEEEKIRLEQEALQEQLTHNFQEEVKERERLDALRNCLQTMLLAQMPLVPNTEPFTCPICLDEIQPEEGVKLRECLHCICRPCLEEHVMLAETPEVICPSSEDGINCEQVITAQEIQAVLSPVELDKYLQRSVNAAESKAANSFHCKTPNCAGWCYYEDDVNWFPCGVCLKKNCLTCKAIHEGKTCQEYQDDLKVRAENDDAAKKTQKMLEEMIRKGDAMNCPQCAVVLQKKSGCDWMRCSMCRTEICWATKGRRWGPKGNGDTSGGCQCTPAKRCHPNCGNCH